MNKWVQVPDEFEAVEVTGGYVLPAIKWEPNLGPFEAQESQDR